jgi:hypothetical protein
MILLGLVEAGLLVFAQKLVVELDLVNLKGALFLS